MVSTLDAVDKLTVSNNVFDSVMSIVPGLAGVWMSVRGSCVLELWDPDTLSIKLLYDIRTGKNSHNMKKVTLDMTLRPMVI